MRTEILRWSSLMLCGKFETFFGTFVCSFVCWRQFTVCPFDNEGLHPRIEESLRVVGVVVTRRHKALDIHGHISTQLVHETLGWPSVGWGRMTPVMGWRWPAHHLMWVTHWWAGVHLVHRRVAHHVIETWKYCNFVDCCCSIEESLQ